MSDSGASVVLAVLSDVAGLLSSGVLLIWSLRVGPLQRTLAATDAVKAAQYAAAVAAINQKARDRLAALLKQEPTTLAASAALLGLSFLLSIASHAA